MQIHLFIVDIFMVHIALKLCDEHSEYLKKIARWAYEYNRHGFWGIDQTCQLNMFLLNIHQFNFWKRSKTKIWFSGRPPKK